MQIENLILKSITVAYNNSLSILLNLDVVQVLCLPTFILNLLMNAFVHLYHLFSFLCRLHQSENPSFVNYFHTDIHFTRPMYTYYIPYCVYILLYCILFSLFCNIYFNHLLNLTS